MFPVRIPWGEMQGAKSGPELLEFIIVIDTHSDLIAFFIYLSPISIFSVCIRNPHITVSVIIENNHLFRGRLRSPLSVLI
jgi:hypothetical protein